MNHDERQPIGPGGVDAQHKQVTTSGTIVLALATLGLVIYLATDHWPHLLAALPYVGIIAVIGVHLLMHRGHNHAGPKHASPSHAGPIHAGPDHAGPDHAGPDHAGHDHAGHDQRET